MLKECCFLMVHPSHDNYYIQQRSSPCLENLDFLSLDGRRHQDCDSAGIATGVLGLGTEGELLASPASSLPLVDDDEAGAGWKPGALQSGMIDSAAPLAHSIVCFAASQGVACVGVNGGPGIAGKEKRMRSDAGLASSAETSGEPVVKRGFQDCPEAPLRKRVHVCESEPGANQIRGTEPDSSTDLGGVTKVEDGGRGVDSEEKGGLAARIPSTPLRSEGNGEGGDAGGRAVERGDVEMSTEDPDDTTEEDVSGLRSSVPQVETTMGTETETTDMEVDPSHVEKAGLDERLDSVSEEPGNKVSVFEREVLASEVNGVDFVATVQGQTSRELDPPPGVDEIGEGDGRNGVPREEPSVVIIDDSDDEPVGMNDFESDGSSTKGTKPISRFTGPPQRRGYRFSLSQSTSSSYSPDEESDSDDCQVIGSHPPPVIGQTSLGQRGDPSLHVYDGESDEESTSDESDSSDVEDVGTSQSDIRRMWEDAAMRRRMGRAMQSEGSKANGEHEGPVNLDDDRTEYHGMAESVATSTYRGSPDSKDQTETSEARGGADAFVTRTDGQHGTSSMFGEEQQPVGQPEMVDVFSGYGAGGAEIRFAASDSATLNGVRPTGSQEGVVDAEQLVDVQLTGNKEHGKVEILFAGEDSENRKGVSSSGAYQNGTDMPQRAYVELQEFGNEARERQGGVSVVVDEVGGTTANEDLLAVKERLKQTPHYRRADAEEWASRQQEIERQAIESKKLRLRRRQEADRRKETERKQKERIEQLRLSQLKEERNMGLREQLRGQVRAELEKIASTCNDFATLLRQLGIPVEGGSHPSAQHVTAAYKKALKKFHPDRAVASTQGDPRHQVEAEEKFKLILRLKNTLEPVAIAYSHPYR